MAHHSIQPLEVDGSGRVVFKGNPIVRFLLDNGPFDMNAIAANPSFSREDREHFAQLIGYSFSGACELSYMSEEVLQAAEHAHAQPDSAHARVAVLQEQLKTLRDQLRGPMAALFGVHPDDLGPA